MSGRCEECGANTVWDQDIGSAICLQCGTLADPTQSVLTSHLEQTNTSGHEFLPWMNLQGAGTLRGRNGWSLAGQGKEARDRKNTIAMHEFIRTLAIRLSNQGIATRAQGIFDQAMRVGQYRWGRKAKLTAGAALAIALRDFHKSDSIRDIAYLLDEPPTAISRAFSKVTRLLQLDLSVADPASHVTILQTHLLSLLKGSTDGKAAETACTLPTQLTKVLSPLIPRLPSVSHTAVSLSALIGRTNLFTHLPTPPTGCALFMLALEGELTSSLPNGAVFAQALGARFGVGKGVVMQRYKQIYDLVEEWIRDVPWLDAHERKKAKGREGGGRSKVAKRIVVARGLKDVVQFQEEIWRRRVEGGGRPVVQLDLDERDGEESSDEWDSSAQSTGTSQTLGEDTGPRRKKAKGSSHLKNVAEASHFLLNPLSSTAVYVHASSASSSRASTSGPPDLLTHLLTADAAALPHAFKQAPTRLQLLATERGGADEEHIADEELFVEGELEGLVRDAAEAEIVRVAMGWDVQREENEDGDGDGKVPGEKPGTKGKKRKRGSQEGDAEERSRGSKRINMDVLARLLDPDADLDAEGLDGKPGRDASGGLEDDENDEDDNEDEEDEEEAADMHGPDWTPSMQCGQAAEEEVVEEWRPMSPGGGGFAAEDWYDL